MEAVVELGSNNLDLGERPPGHTYEIVMFVVVSNVEG